MSLATNATDKQVGSILEAFQVATPELAAQAVAYYRVVNIGWLALLVPLTVILAVICHRCLKRRTGYETAAAVSGLCAVFTFFISAIVACEVVKSYVAADYYAAECIAKLVGKALGN